MSGAIADPLVNTIRTPSSRMIMIRGNSQNFFCWFRKPHKSLRKSIANFSFALAASVGLFEIPADKRMVPLQHNRILASLENAKLQSVLTNQPPQDADWSHHEKENDGERVRQMLPRLNVRGGIALILHNRGYNRYCVVSIKFNNCCSIDGRALWGCSSCTGTE